MTTNKLNNYEYVDAFGMAVIKTMAFFKGKKLVDIELSEKIFQEFFQTEVLRKMEMGRREKQAAVELNAARKKLTKLEMNYCQAEAINPVDYLKAKARS